MKKIFIIVIASILYFSNAFAVTLLDALNQTYQNNIQLNAERENIKASYKVTADTLLKFNKVIQTSIKIFFIFFYIQQF